MEETPKSLIEGFIQTAQTHQTEVPKRWKHALIRTPDKMPSPGVNTRSATKRKRLDLPDKTPRAMIETYMTNANTELLPTVRTRRRRSFNAAPVNVTADNFTPRTNIAMLIEQGVEETPYVRPQTRRSSRKSLPALPASDTIQLLPMSPSIEDQSATNSSRRRSRRSNTGSTRSNSTESTSKKRKSSTGHLTSSALESISDSIQLLVNFSSGDEDADDSRKRLPIRRSPRSNLTSSSKMFGFKEVLSSYEGTEEDSMIAEVDPSENILVPSSQENKTASNSSPVRIPNMEEIQDSPNKTSVGNRGHNSSVSIPETQEENMTSGGRTLDSSPLKPLPPSQSEDGAEADDESEESERSPDTPDKYDNVSCNAVEVVGSDRNQSKPEVMSSVNPVDNNENDHGNSIFDMSTSLADIEDQADRNVRGNTDMAVPSTGVTNLVLGMEDQAGENVEGITYNSVSPAGVTSLVLGMEDQAGKGVRGNVDMCVPSTGVANEDREDSNKETSVREIEEEDDEGDAGADFVLDEGSPHIEEEEQLVDKDADVESEEELEETEEVTEDVTENFRLAKTPKLATPQYSKGPGLQPLTDILNRKSAPPLRSVNEVLRDTGDSTTLYVKKTQRKTKAKTRQTAPLPVSVIKNVFSHYCKMKVSSDVLPELINVTEKFFKQVPADLEAFCHHAGRKTIDDTDVELLMKRQRLIKDNNSLDVLIEENLPLEYRLQLIPIARAGNIVHPK